MLHGDNDNVPIRWSHCEYYQGDWTALPAWEPLSPVRVTQGSSLAAFASQPEYAALRVYGTVTLDSRGMCGGALVSAGPSQVLFDGKVEVVINGLTPPVQSLSYAVVLDKGEHQICLLYLRGATAPRLELSLSPPSKLILDIHHWVYFGSEGDWPKSWSFMRGALAPGRQMPPITYTVELAGQEYAPDETAPDRRQHIEWSLAGDGLPSPVSSWRAGVVRVTVQHPAARIANDSATAVFTRVTLINEGAAALRPCLRLGASPEREVPLSRQPDAVKTGRMNFLCQSRPAIPRRLTSPPAPMAIRHRSC